MDYSLFLLKKYNTANVIIKNATRLFNKNFINIVRFGNVFGSSGSAINNFLEQINTNNPINLTDIRATRYFMTILEACHLVLQTTEIKSKKDIFVLTFNIFKKFTMVNNL